MSNFDVNMGFMYQVSNDGTYAIANAQPVAMNVDISGTTDVLYPHSIFDISGADGPYDGAYSFVSKGEDPTGNQGLIVKDTNGQLFFLSNHMESGTNVPLTAEHGGAPICFMPGTLVRTPEGESPVETLTIGDLVSTLEGRDLPVRWVGRQTIVRTFADPTHLPIRIKANALADNMPLRDLLVSPNHAILLDDVLIQAGCLVNGTTIVQQNDIPDVFTYYHIELDDHALIIAEGTPAETFLDSVDRRRFDNWQEHEALYGPDKALAELPHPRAKAYRQVPTAIRQRINRRGEDLRVPGERAA